MTFTHDIVKNTRITTQFLYMKILTMVEYRIDFLMDSIAELSELIIFFLMWRTILGANATIPGWGLDGLLILYGFQQIFRGLYFSIGQGAADLVDIINKGELDILLSRPANPWLLALLEGISPSVIGGIVVGGLSLIIAHIYFGFTIFTPVLVLLLFMILVGLAITTISALTFACIGFWFGNIENIRSIWNALFNFERYPMTLFSPILVIGMSFLLPLVFTQTIPALVILEKMSVGDAIKWLGVELIILLINFVIFQIVWSKGLKRYESYGG